MSVTVKYQVESRHCTTGNKIHSFNRLTDCSCSSEMSLVACFQTKASWLSVCSLCCVLCRKCTTLVADIFTLLGAGCSCACVAAAAPELLMVGRILVGINSGQSSQSLYTVFQKKPSPQTLDGSNFVKS